MFNLKRISAFIIVSLGFPILCFAQLTIQGTITDDRGAGLPGANIIVKGTILGTASDDNGNFTLIVSRPSGQTIIEAHYIGYTAASQTVTEISGIVELNFALAVDALSFDEIVITGSAAPTSKVTGS